MLRTKKLTLAFILIWTLIVLSGVGPGIVVGQTVEDVYIAAHYSPPLSPSEMSFAAATAGVLVSGVDLSVSVRRATLHRECVGGWGSNCDKHGTIIFIGLGYPYHLGNFSFATGGRLGGADWTRPTQPFPTRSADGATYAIYQSAGLTIREVLQPQVQLEYSRLAADRPAELHVSAGLQLSFRKLFR